jgi:hypothetical protein
LVFDPWMRESDGSADVLLRDSEPRRARSRVVIERREAQARSVQTTDVAAPFAELAAGGCIGFFFAYGVLHALQLAGAQPALITELSPIPLFANVLGSIPLAVITGVGACMIPCSRSRLLGWLARALAVACALFTLEVVFFP